jgi:acid phosphatase type 7
VSSARRPSYPGVVTSTRASRPTHLRAALVAAALPLLVPVTAHAERRVVERPAAGPPGSVVMLAGTGFRARHAVVVTTAGRAPVRVRADRRGRFTAVVRTSARPPAGGRVDVRASDGRGRTISRFRVRATVPASQTAEAASQHGARLRWTPSVVRGAARVRLQAAGLPRRARGRLTWAGRTVRVRTDRHGALARTVRLTATTARGRRGSLRVRARRIGFAVALQPAPGPGTVDPPGLDVPPLTPPAFDSGGDPVVAAAGDIACAPGDPSFNAGLGSARYCRQFWTYRLVAAMAPTAVLGLGDFQYEDGSLAAYHGSYDRSWGRLKGITYPAPGNGHDSSGAGDYLAYWASRLPSSAPYRPYSFDLGAWHLVSLPSNCRNPAIDCSTGGTLDRWLQADLAAHPAACTLAFWHNPRWNSPSDTHGSSEFDVDAFAQTLHDHGAEVILSGDNHNYERFAPQDGTGARDPAKGVTQFVVGTGGKVLMPFVGTAPNSVARDDQHFGALRLALHAGSFAWQFVTETGAVTDSGSRACH